MEIKCSTCGRELAARDEEKTWRKCTFCKKPVCFDDIHYIGVQKRGLYGEYIEVMPVCEKDMLKKR